MSSRTPPAMTAGLMLFVAALAVAIYAQVTMNMRLGLLAVVVVLVSLLAITYFGGASPVGQVAVHRSSPAGQRPQASTASAIAPDPIPTPVVSVPRRKQMSKQAEIITLRLSRTKAGLAANALRGEAARDREQADEDRKLDPQLAEEMEATARLQELAAREIESQLAAS